VSSPFSVTTNIHFLVVPYPGVLSILLLTLQTIDSPRPPFSGVPHPFFPARSVPRLIVQLVFIPHFSNCFVYIKQDFHLSLLPGCIFSFSPTWPQEKVSSKYLLAQRPIFPPSPEFLRDYFDHWSSMARAASIPRPFGSLPPWHADPPIRSPYKVLYYVDLATRVFSCPLS